MILNDLTDEHLNLLDQPVAPAAHALEIEELDQWQVPRRS